MNVLTEADLRTNLCNAEIEEYTVPKGTFITPMAREYLRERGIKLKAAEDPTGMPVTPLPDKGSETYVDAVTGEGYAEKPERMTHIRGNLLVTKDHPRIIFRGKLDTLQALVLCIQAKTGKKEDKLVRDLEEILLCLRLILGAEVKEIPLASIKILGMTDKELRIVSHNVKEEIGINHPIPASQMGETALAINYLRTQIREVELSAMPLQREDISQHLNRLSSAVYIIFCRYLAGFYKREEVL